jgi:hypothetical protein
MLLASALAHFGISKNYIYNFGIRIHTRKTFINE